jgi:hypothetical protein
MKHVKMLGLAVVAVVALTALLGAGSASATVLCKTLPSKGVCGSKYPANTLFSAKATGATLETNTENVTCKTSSTAVKNTAESGSPLPGEVTSLSFGECTSSSNAACTVTSVGTPWTGSVAWTSGGNGTLTVANGGARVSCGFGFLQCRFGAKSLSLEIQGGNPAKVIANKVPLEMTAEEGFLKCPTEAKWTATYETTSPTALWVAKE